MVRVLRLDAAVEGAVLVAHLAVEGRLIVAAGFQAEHPLMLPSGREREDEAWRHGKLLVEGPVVRPQPAVKYPLLVFVNCPGGLNEPIESDGVKMREDPVSRSKDFVFTIDGTRYFCSFQLENDKDVKVDSLAGLMKLIGDYSYVK